MDYAQLGGRIKRERIRQQLTQLDLAEMVHMDSELLGKIERGSTHPDIEQILGIADALECSLDMLFGRGDDEKKAMTRIDYATDLLNVALHLAIRLEDNN